MKSTLKSSLTIAQANRVNPNWRRLPYQFWLLYCWKSSHWFHWVLVSWASKHSMRCNCHSSRLLSQLAWPFFNFAERFVFHTLFHLCRWIFVIENNIWVIRALLIIIIYFLFVFSFLRIQIQRSLQLPHGIPEDSLMHHKLMKPHKILHTMHTTSKMHDI